MKVNIVSPVTGDAGKITKVITFQRDGSDASRLIAVPMGLANLENLFPARVARMRSNVEVKNGRKRILVETSIPYYSQYTQNLTTMAYEPVTSSLVMAKVHSVLELPFTDPVIPGGDAAAVSRQIALHTLLRLHAMNFIPSLATTGAALANQTGTCSATGLDSEYINSPFVRGSFGLNPLGDEVELGTEDTTVE